MSRLATECAPDRALHSARRPVLHRRRLLDIQTRTLLALCVTVVCWASAYPGIRAGLHAYTPAHLALMRYGVASIVLAVYAVATRMPLPRWRDIPGFALTGLAGVAVYNLLLNSGEVRVSAGVASFIVAISPILVALEAIILMKERVLLWGWAGIAVSFTGVAAIALEAKGGIQINGGVLLVLGAALAQSLYFVGQKSYLRRYGALQCTTYAIWTGTIALLIFVPGLPDQMRAAPLDTSLAVMYLGVVPGAIGFVTWAYALARLPASRAGSFLYCVPVLALVIAWVWLGEVPSIFAVAGGCLVLAGVILVNTRGRKIA